MSSKNIFFVVSVTFLSFSAFAETAVVQTIGDRKGDSAILIQKTSPSAILPDYEIVDGSEEITSEPTKGSIDSRKEWKVECKDWKTDMRKMNGTNLISLNCGTPKTSIREPGSDFYITTSTASYKVKTRIKDSGSSSKP